ncbi:putative zinc protease [Phycisphaerales bacterium]|nr:putative zinc protease [Phycisphaerales bacterium]
MGEIKSRTLKCGAPLIVERMDGVRSAAVTWLVPCGGAFDPADRLGRATMWGELLMRGGGALNSREQADAFDRLGVSRGTESGAFTFRIGATLLGEHLEEALPLLVDMALRPRMDEDAVEPARDLALQALASVNDEPHERAGLLIRAKHQPPPLDRSGLGTEEGLKSLSREELVNGWRECAKPAESIFAAAGVVDIDGLEARLNALLDRWSGTNPEPAVGPTPARGYHHEEDDTNQVQILIAHDAPAEPDNDSLLEKLTVGVLSGGMAGRLFSEVREKRGLCYSVNAGYRGDRDYGAVTAYVGTTPERAQDSLDVLWGELQRIMSVPGRVTPEEFNRARVGMKSGLVFSGESTGARSSALASDQRRLGRPRSLEEIAAKIDAVTLDQLNAYLARRSLGKVTIVTLGPKGLKSPG